MVETILCGYCEELPANGRAAAANVHRCPLCKTELGVSRAGQRFRIDADAIPPSRGGLLIAMLTVVAVVAAAVTFTAWTAMHTRVPEPIVAQPPPPATIVQSAAAAVSQTPTVPGHLAARKAYTEGVLSPEARVKIHSPDNVNVSVATTTQAPQQPPQDKVGKSTATGPVASKPAAAKLAGAPSNLPVNFASGSVAELQALVEVALEPLPQKATGKVSADVKDKQARSKELVAARKHIEELARAIQEKNGKEPDGYVRWLRDERADVAGLPFLLGSACQISATEAKLLREASLRIRTALSNTDRMRQPPNSGQWPSEASRFWNALMQETVSGGPRSSGSNTTVLLLPGLLQILGPEHPSFRVEIVNRSRDWTLPYVTAALARLAIYDPEPSVRMDALDALRERPVEHFVDILVAGLRYPWAPVAQRAADALVDVGRKDVVTRLIDMLDDPDPSDAFEQDQKGKTVHAVRELVKINHHRNCLLCHAPAGVRTSDLPVGPVPSSAESLPPSRSTVYYAERSGVTLARADVTYLRQDFSVMLPVEDAAPWPKMQRFDFLVRTRVLTDAELAAHLAQKRARGPLTLTPHQEALLSALRRLTGLDAGPRAAAWRLAISAAQNEKRE